LVENRGREVVPGDAAPWLEIVRGASVSEGMRLRGGFGGTDLSVMGFKTGIRGRGFVGEKWLVHTARRRREKRRRLTCVARNRRSMLV
jgi:hypothetical protein